jgi:hypothetical protein
MPVFDPPTLFAIAAVISSFANLVWALRRRASTNMTSPDDRVC